MTALPTTTEPQRAMRGDAEPSRARLMRAALALFAQHGYAKTSTREIAEAAHTNVAAISYYFGDKAGLYRAVFFEPLGAPCETVRSIAAEPSLEQALRALYTGLLEPLRQGDLARQCMKLHFRELLEPTGLWDADFTHGMRPMHDALVAALVRHLGLKRADDEVLRLAVCIAGLGVHLHVGRDVIDTLAPKLNAGSKSLDAWMQRLVMYARAMVDAEAQRRATPAPGQGSTNA
jgi:TetR/AcrR family transcriptional regulator, regulator of cefoperazone and chloramphenicol sensitivity